jgi:hypothetical protein
VLLLCRQVGLLSGIGIHVDESIKLIAAATGGGASSARARRLSPTVLAGLPGLGASAGSSQTT